MSFFQHAVLNKYLKTLNNDIVQTAYKKFANYFHNPEIQNNIRDAKEEQFQEGFLRELFVNIFGYCINPEPHYNLTTEFKNLTGAKKADGAILIEGKAIAVIELKGTDTKDLDKINEQAFNYKNNQTNCIYVITSNFEKLRFFIHNSVDHIEFNLFTLTENEFYLLWLCLSADSLFSGVPDKIKAESLLEEENITKYLYKDYAAFRTALWQNMVLRNPEVDQLTLFKKTQKLLDRFLFVFFAEDSGLLPPNSISRMIDRCEILKEEQNGKPLYEIFKQFFDNINTGRTGKTANDDIFAFNGGLFLPDEILDKIQIDDEVLRTHTLKLSGYDFQSEVDVNILGHIFENSLNEIENVKAQIEGQEIDKSKSKRKKDGIFYTPKYITKYIVENTLGKLCEEKKAELSIIDEEYAKGRKYRKKEILVKLNEQLKTYREWLLNITICDPACGSGAFLNQALEYLIEEHQYLDELQAQLLGGSFIFPDVENHILEKNIFGVDINEESVDIAKLSLWLRTAQRGRKLTSLNNNIKCGNSLIDDPTVAGEKAFNWQNEFPEVFANGGFDVVIGNPPYVNSKRESFSDKDKRYFIEKYSTAVYQIELYVLFMERSIQLINNNGFSAFIVPNAWLNNLFQIEVRRFLLNNIGISEIVAMPSNTFEQANVDTVIVTMTNKDKVHYTKLLRYNDISFIEISSIEKKSWEEKDNLIININANENTSSLLDKIKLNTITLESFTEIARGVGVYHKRVGHTKEFINSDPFQSNFKKDETFVPYLRGKNVASWFLQWNNDSFISYGKWLAEPREPKYFEGSRIILRQIPAERLIAAYIENDFIIDQSVFIAKFNNQVDINPKGVLAVLSSKLMSFYFRNSYSEFDELFPKLKLQHFKDLPIKESLIKYNGPLNEKADLMLSLNKELQTLSNKFCAYFSGQYKLEKLGNKLEKWYELEFHDFITELNKAIKTVKGTAPTKKDEFEWIDVFNDNKQKALVLKTEIEKTDKEIDAMVYELYQLTPEEISIIESKA